MFGHLVWRFKCQLSILALPTSQLPNFEVRKNYFTGMAELAEIYPYSVVIKRGDFLLIKQIFKTLNFQRSWTETQWFFQYESSLCLQFQLSCLTPRKWYMIQGVPKKIGFSEMRCLGSFKAYCALPYYLVHLYRIPGHVYGLQKTFVCSDSAPFTPIQALQEKLKPISIYIRD